MRDPLYDDSLFFFALQARDGLFRDFRQIFSLSLSPAHGEFDLVDQDRNSFCQTTNCQTTNLADFLKMLDVRPDAHFDFHLLDRAGEGYMFCHRADNHRILGLPYGTVNDDALEAMGREFNAICGWGAGAVAPPDTIAQMWNDARAPHTAFARYLNGRIIPAN